MKSIKITIFLVCFINFIYGQNREVLILGTAHYSNIKSDSINSDQKQKELKGILDALIKFNPQQILVERPSVQDSIFDTAFEYAKKGQNLPKDIDWLLNNEIYQLGIRVAAELRLPQSVQGIDWRLPNLNSKDDHFTSDIEKNYFLYAKSVLDPTIKYEVDNVYSESIASIHRQFGKYYGIEKNISLKEMYLTLNDRKNIEKLYIANRLSELYLDPKLGAERTEIGSFRDYKTFRSALNTIKPETKRILIIYGAGHTHMLRQLFQFSGQFKLREIDEFLR
ncbi:hypothetical protein M2347_002096 [Chryseobacterium sp. H1D6B]|uniref:DUF5694 domain-containing protein n=1 Tax=Chryseobacterium sp. H1D6B TaxID=2940588 RepID=UPI0015CCDA97|nr:DUF5694 domain-containing protein [Chryseobacterium sp. H1D6B]MDH6252369.1 hypothetical protein [Chryseobacterium sp. H1D6B]